MPRVAWRRLVEMLPVVETKRLCKYFKGVVALNEVSVSISAGEVVGLVGDNGAGKSTLVKILSGDLEPSAGQVLIDGEPVHFRHPRDAKKRQIETIYQDLALCENLDVMENVFLGHESYRNPILRLLDRRRMYRETGELLDRFGINIPSTREYVMNLSGGQRQATALARVAKAGARLIILDEPTAALDAAPQQTEDVSTPQSLEQAPDTWLRLLIKKLTQILAILFFYCWRERRVGLIPPAFSRQEIFNAPPKLGCNVNKDSFYSPFNEVCEGNNHPVFAKQ